MIRPLIRIGSLAAALCCIGAASAAVLTYDVAGTIVGSPLDGQTFGGHFTVEEAPGGLLGVQLPLLDLEFRFDGVTYDEDDVAGAAMFHPQGGELLTLFGTGCTDPGGGIVCWLPDSSNAWYLGVANGGAGLGFSREGATYFTEATVTLRERNTVPEPASPALALCALTAMAGAGLTRRLRSGGR